MQVESSQEQRVRRRELRQIPSEDKPQLLAEYNAYADDQLVTERHVCVRLGYSRAWTQQKRHVGGGPRFHRTGTGKILYRKSDVEAFIKATLTAHNSTSEYAPAESSK